MSPIAFGQMNLGEIHQTGGENPYIDWIFVILAEAQKTKQKEKPPNSPPKPPHAGAAWGTTVNSQSSDRESPT